VDPPPLWEEEGLPALTLEASGAVGFEDFLLESITVFESCSVLLSEVKCPFLEIALEVELNASPFDKQCLSEAAGGFRHTPAMCFFWSFPDVLVVFFEADILHLVSHQTIAKFQLLSLNHGSPIINLPALEQLLLVPHAVSLNFSSLRMLKIVCQ